MNTSHNEPVPWTSSQTLPSQAHCPHCRLTGGLQCSVTGPYHMPQFYDLCSSPNTIRVMQWPGHVAHMRKKRNLYTAFTRKTEGRSLLGKPNCRLISSGSGYRKVVSFCEHGDKTWGCIKMRWTLQPAEHLWSSQGLCSMEWLYKNTYTQARKRHWLNLSGWVQECIQRFAGCSGETSVWCPAVLVTTYFIFCTYIVI
jgi:hypothetical protein